MDKILCTLKSDSNGLIMFHTRLSANEHEILWGDAKAANALLDSNDDAYLVDSGGGYTKDWVEKEKFNSIEGSSGTWKHQASAL